MHIIIAIIILIILFYLIKKVGGCLIKAIITLFIIGIILKILFAI